MDKHCDVFTKCNTIQLKKKKKHTQMHNTWMNLKNIMLKERSQTSKNVYYILYTYI